MQNKTWDLVPQPHNKSIVGCKWVYNTKYNSNGDVNKDKACLVDKGYWQVEAFD